MSENKKRVFVTPLQIQIANNFGLTDSEYEHYKPIVLKELATVEAEDKSLNEYVEWLHTQEGIDYLIYKEIQNKKEIILKTRIFRIKKRAKKSAPDA